MSLEPWHQTSCIWGSRPSTHWMNSCPLVPPLPKSEGLRMDPTGLHRVMFLEKLQWLEWAGRSQNKNIVTELILKLEGKIRILGAKIFLWVYHLWTWLLLIRTRPMEKCQQLTRFLLVQKRQTPHHWNDQRICQHDQRSLQYDQWVHQNEKEKRMYQRTRSQTHHCQTHHQKNLILLMIQVTVNQTKIKAMRRKSVGTQETGLVRLSVEWFWFVQQQWLQMQAT